MISKNGYLIVKPIIEKEKDVSGIIVSTDTTATEEDIAKGEVIVGNDNYKKGSVVYFNKLIPGIIRYKIDGKEEELLAILENDVMFIE